MYCGSPKPSLGNLASQDAAPCPALTLFTCCRVVFFYLFIWLCPTYLTVSKNWVFFTYLTTGINPRKVHAFLENYPKRCTFYSVYTACLSLDIVDSKKAKEFDFFVHYCKI